MKHLKTLIAGAVVAVVACGAGLAYAQGTPDSGEGTSPPPEATSNLLGAGSTEAKFVAIAPCRLVDTREAGGAISAGTTRRYDVRGTGGTFAAQGGKSNGCGIPTGGVAGIEVTATAISATGTGFLRVFPEGEQNATFMNYTPTFNASNTGTVSLCGSTGNVCVVNQDLGVKNYGSTTHLVLEVTGYYAQPMAAAVNGDGSVVRSSRLASVTRLGAGEYRVTFDRDVQQCTFYATLGKGIPAGVPDGEVSAQRNAAFNDAAFVQTRTPAGALADRDFNIEVTC